MPTIIVVIIKLAWHFTLVHNICVGTTLSHLFRTYVS